MLKRAASLRLAVGREGPGQSAVSRHRVEVAAVARHKSPRTSEFPGMSPRLRGHRRALTPLLPRVAVPTLQVAGPSAAALGSP